MSTTHNTHTLTGEIGARPQPVLSWVRLLFALDRGLDPRLTNAPHSDGSDLDNSGQCVHTRPVDIAWERFLDDRVVHLAGDDCVLFSP